MILVDMAVQRKKKNHLLCDEAFLEDIVGIHGWVPGITFFFLYVLLGNWAYSLDYGVI